ncbi:MAG: hypothetical protein JNM76_02640 [Betaproteobacteria bacterium]|nr:hypothetical protein [Betaproteobacteria bacterium]
MSRYQRATSIYAAVARETLAIATCLMSAAVLASSPMPAPEPPPVARDLHVVLLPSGFRVEGVYISESRHVLELVQATRPKSVVVKVCKLTPEKVVAQFQNSLYDIFQGGQVVQAMPRNALECAFPTERERGVKGS